MMMCRFTAGWALPSAPAPVGSPAMVATRHGEPGFPLIDTITLEGGHALRGEVSVRGAKNSISKQLVSALLTTEKSTLYNTPAISDTFIVSDMLRAMGVQVSTDDDGAGAVSVHAEKVTPLSRDRLSAFSGKSRIPILLCGPLLHRTGEALIPTLGGDDIGKRQVNWHLMALEQLGAEIDEQPDGWYLKTDGLVGCEIRLPFPSVGATEQVLLSAVLAEGTTTLHGAAIEPEILDIIAVLQKMGAAIMFGADRTIVIHGQTSLHGYDHTAIPDRLEVASWACAAIATHGEIFVRNARVDDMVSFLGAYRMLGGSFTASPEGIHFKREESELNPVDLETAVHPGLMTDWQAPLGVTLTQAKGTSTIHETVYENRFGYTNALVEMGADIRVSAGCPKGKACRFGGLNHAHLAEFHGVTHLKGADVEVPDLRAGFSHVIAALLAEGRSTIRNVKLVDRGYEGFLDKLEVLGARVVSAS
jgi:UDP-N-acetylglucosamine 1-carboxyvinyltransferase